MSSSRKHDEIQGEIVHEYDGIQEADNALPRWWLWTLYAAMVFSVGYWFYYEEFKVGAGPVEAYYAERAREAEKSGADPTDGELLAAVDGPMFELGKQAFLANCVACHDAQGQGKIGPNLTDSSWLHGGAPSEIFRTVRDGVPAKGMPAWGPVLGRGGVVQVTSFVLSLRDKNVPGGKAAEGTVYDPSAAAAPAPATEAPAAQVPSAPAPASSLSATVEK